MQNAKHEEHQFKPNRGQNFDKVKMSRFCGKKHLFHLRYLFTYYIVKHMDASVFKSLFFFFFLHLSFSDVATTADGSGGPVSASVFRTDRAQFEPRILGL